MVIETEVTHTPLTHDSRLDRVRDPRRLLDRRVRQASTNRPGGYRNWLPFLCGSDAVQPRRRGRPADELEGEATGAR